MARRYNYAFWIKDESHKHIEVSCFGYHLGVPGKGADWTIETDPELDRSESNFIHELKKAGNSITFGFDADQRSETWFPKLTKGRMLDALILRIMTKDDNLDRERRMSMYRVEIMNLSTTTEKKAGYPKPFLELRCKVDGSVWQND